MRDGWLKFLHLQYSHEKKLFSCCQPLDYFDNRVRLTRNTSELIPGAVYYHRDECSPDSIVQLLECAYPSGQLYEWKRINGYVPKGDFILIPCSNAVPVPAYPYCWLLVTYSSRSRVQLSVYYIRGLTHG